MSWCTLNSPRQDKARGRRASSMAYFIPKTGAVMDAETIAQALDGRKYGNGYRAPCPICGGSNKSTKFTIRQDGDRILVHCFAGCSQDEVIHELKSCGLWPDATPEQRQRYREHKSQQEIESGKTWFVIAESAVERGDKLSRRERQRFHLLKRLYGGGHE